MRRSDQRRDAVFALYQREVTGRGLDELLEGAKPFTRELAEGVDGEIEALDEEIGRLSRGWSLERIASLERCIMRVALYEMRHRDDVPVEVAIDEAVGLAKEFCGADAPVVRQRDPRLGGARARGGAVVSEPAPGGGVAAEVEAIAGRLREIAERLRDPDLGDEPAAALAREAADLVGEAGNTIDRALAEADED